MPRSCGRPRCRCPWSPDRASCCRRPGHCIPGRLYSRDRCRCGRPPVRLDRSQKPLLIQFFCILAVRRSSVKWAGGRQTVFQPVQQIGPHLPAVLLMEEFMPGPGIEVEGEVPAAGVLKHSDHLFHAAAHAAHRVLLAGEKADRDGGIHPGQLVPPGDELEAAPSCPGTGRRWGGTGEGVGEKGVHLRRVPGEPVGGGAAGAEAPVVRAKGQGVYQRTDPTGDPGGGTPGLRCVCPAPPKVRAPVRCPSAQRRTPCPATGSDRSGSEGAHRVPQEKIREIRMARPSSFRRARTSRAARVQPFSGAKKP